jgi:hypothetical protein
MTADLPGFSTPAGYRSGTDGASAADTRQITVTIQAGAIVVQGQGAQAGQEAAEAILERLAAATLAR